MSDSRMHVVHTLYKINHLLLPSPITTVEELSNCSATNHSFRAEQTELQPYVPIEKNDFAWHNARPDSLAGASDTLHFARTTDDVPRTSTKSVTASVREIDHPFIEENYHTRLRGDTNDFDSDDAQWGSDSDAQPSDLESNAPLNEPNNEIIFRRHDGSDYQSDGNSSVYTLDAPIHETETRHKRIYEKKSTRPFPIDEAAKDLLDFQHHVFCLCNQYYFEQDLHFIKLPQVHRVLDVDTGTGIWAIEFAKKYPESMVIGMDTFPMQPTRVPTNLEFQIVDSEEWRFTYPFDFIHHRTWMTTLTSVDHFLGRVLHNLRAGGYFEGTFVKFPIKWESEPTPRIERWSQLMNEAIAKKQYNEITTSAMDDAGFVNVVENVYKWPMNAHHKDWKMKGRKLREIAYGSQQSMCEYEAMKGLSVLLFREVLGLGLFETELLLIEAIKEMISPCNVATWEIITISGRKNA